jgi:hypothetical protein
MSGESTSSELATHPMPPCSLGVPFEFASVTFPETEKKQRMKFA